MKQWLRKLKLTIEGAGDAIDLSELRVRFRIEQSDLQRPNVGTITITNPARNTAEKIRAEGKTVTLEAGYEEGTGVLFKGDIIQKRVGRENPTDTYAEVICQSGDRAYNFATVSKTLSAGATWKDIVNVVLDAMKPLGVTAGYIADLPTRPFPRAKTFFGMARDVMREVAQSTGTTWSIQDDKLTVMSNRKAPPGEAFVLNSNTGLIGRPTQTMNGIIGRMLLNHRVRPGTIVQIDEKSIEQAIYSPNYSAEAQNEMYPSFSPDGFYRCVIVEHEGDTHGTPWYTTFTCLRADGEGPQPIGLANRGIVLDPEA